MWPAPLRSSPPTAPQLRALRFQPPGRCLQLDPLFLSSAAARAPPAAADAPLTFARRPARPPPRRGGGRSERHLHEAFGSVCVQRKEAVDELAFLDWLEATLARHGPRLLRVKASCLPPSGLGYLASLPSLPQRLLSDRSPLPPPRDCSSSPTGTRPPRCSASARTSSSSGCHENRRRRRCSRAAARASSSSVALRASSSL